MKSKKVLIGLIMMAFVGSAGLSEAQTKANYQNDLIEIGPDNVGGRTRAIIVDQSDASHKTLYVGGVAGGLFTMEVDSAAWEYLPYYTDDNEEVTLPISCMVQTPDNMIYIGTGEGFATGTNANKALIAPKGTGLLRFNPATKAFSTIANTSSINYINRLAYLYRDGKLYFFMATNDGLYRWIISSESDWNTAPVQVFGDAAVQDVIVVSGDNMAFFTSGSNVYKIGNITSSSDIVNISASCSAFGGNAQRIELSAAKSDYTYLYAMVTNSTGLLDGVYMTTNQQTWIKLSTTTVTPFTANNTGWHNSSIAIDPTNHKRVIIGGAHLWVGQGYVDGANYLWNKTSYSEDELNAGNYMESVYPSTSFVHSGIHQIVANPEITDGDTTWVYYMATDGGVFKTDATFGSFQSMNKGFNTVQFNGIAVAPDGSVLGGAIDNACPFVEARLNHSGGVINNTWYDNTTRMNHIGNVLWFGNGGQVEASMFQQISPNSRRGLFFSSEGGDFYFTGNQGTQASANYGRAYSDYSDYTNTQTWTSGEAFCEDGIATTNAIPQMVLYETMNNKGLDSITFTIDTLSYIWRNGQQMALSAGFEIQSGDVYRVPSPAHFNYPFEYTFTRSVNVDNERTFTVHNPIANRIFISGRRANGMGVLLMNTTPTDYRKVWSLEDAGASNTMHWYTVFKCDNDGRYHVGPMAVSNDADAVFFAVVDDTTGENFICRIANINACDINNYTTANSQINYETAYEGMPRITTLDTVFRSGSDYRFARTITSLTFDQRNGKDVLLCTFSDGESTEPNLIVINNANSVASRSVTAKNIKGGNANAYSALVEYTTGTVYVGTDKGVFTATESSFAGTPSWSTYGAFNGVPVTSIRQQIRNLASTWHLAHTGINAEFYRFAKTKYPYALYFGTYGRGIFMDMQYVTDTTNEIYDLDITTVDKGANKVSVYPNPAADYANLDIAVSEASVAVLKVYDMNGRCVYTDNMGRLVAGTHTYRLDCNGLRHGMYLINIHFGNQTATSKLIVR